MGGGLSSVISGMPTNLAMGTLLTLEYELDFISQVDLQRTPQPSYCTNDGIPYMTE